MTNIIELAIELEKKYGSWWLERVPEKDRSYELCRLAVKDTGFNLREVPAECKTYEICFAAIKKSPDVLEHVPHEHRTMELCLEATRKTYSFMHIPESILQEVKQRTDEYRANKLVERAWKVIVKHDGMMLKNVPDQFKTKEVCRLAFKANNDAVNYVPHYLLTRDMKRFIKSKGDL
jgi:hypothetical protein